MVECGGLENRWARKGPGGSNPSSSAIFRTNPMRFDWLRTRKHSGTPFEDENSRVVSRLQWKAHLWANPI